MNDMSPSNTVNVYKFKCTDGDDIDYDVTNGAASTRNAAFKWGSEAVSFLRRVSSSAWKYDVSVMSLRPRTSSIGFKCTSSLYYLYFF